MFGRKRVEVRGDGSRLHAEELRGFCSSANNISAIKSKVRWEGHVEPGGEKGHTYRVCGRKRKESSDLDDLGVNAK
jgi:hypothetical protein